MGVKKDDKGNVDDKDTKCRYVMCKCMCMHVFCRDAMGLNLPARACGEGREPIEKFKFLMLMTIVCNIPGGEIIVR